jgi:hypothetical protein
VTCVEVAIKPFLRVRGAGALPLAAIDTLAPAWCLTSRGVASDTANRVASASSSAGKRYESGRKSGRLRSLPPVAEQASQDRVSRLVVYHRFSIER